MNRVYAAGALALAIFVGVFGVRSYTLTREKEAVDQAIVEMVSYRILTPAEAQCPLRWKVTGSRVHRIEDTHDYAANVFFTNMYGYKGVVKVRPTVMGEVNVPEASNSTDVFRGIATEVLKYCKM